MLLLVNVLCANIIVIHAPLVQIVKNAKVGLSKNLMIVLEKITLELLIATM
jgi:hypothetical protein